MPTPELDSLHTLRSDTTVRWILPFSSTLHPFRGSWKDRLGSWFFIAFGLFITAGGALGAWEPVLKVFARLQNRPLAAIDFLIIGVGMAAAIFYGVGVIAGAACILAGFPAHTELFLTETHLGLRDFRGRMFRTRRIPLATITSITVAMPPTTSMHQLSKPFDERRAALRIDRTNSQRRHATVQGYSHRLLKQLAVALTDEFASRRKNPLAVLSAAPPTPALHLPTLDTMDPAYLQADDATPPEGCPYTPTEDGAITSITSPTPNPRKSKSFFAFLRCVFWSLALGLASYFLLPASIFPCPPGSL